MKNLLYFVSVLIFSFDLYSKEFNLSCPVNETITFEIYVAPSPTEQTSYIAILNVVSDEKLYPYSDISTGVVLNVYPSATEFSFNQYDRGQNIIDFQVNRKTLVANGSYRMSKKRNGWRKKYVLEDSKCNIIKETENLI